jgi:hypothetical protein
MAEAVLDRDPAAVDIVRQVITKCDAVEERVVAVRHNDVVLLQLRQRRCTGLGIEEVGSRYPRFR